MGEKWQLLLAMAGYMLAVILIGIYFARKAQASSDNYFLGGRSLGPWVAAMSAEASDMSGWLLMGLPGVAYWCGLADAAWTAIGLAVGTYINWLLVSKRLRAYSAVSGDAITVPDFLSNRFHEKKKVILTIAAGFILIFFTVYTASCFVTCGKLFSGLFGFSYHSMMIAGAVFVLIYTAIGGFLAESASDFMQAVVMIAALMCVLVFGTVHAGGVDAVIENAKAIPGYLSLTSLATPVTDAAGVQQQAAGAPLPPHCDRLGRDLAGRRRLHRRARPRRAADGCGACHPERRGKRVRPSVPAAVPSADRGRHHGGHPRRDHQLVGFLSADRRLRRVEGSV